MGIRFANTVKIREDEDNVDRTWCEARLPPDCSQSMTVDTSNWLSDMYEDVFESVFGSWLGNYSCPFAFVDIYTLLFWSMLTLS